LPAPTTSPAATPVSRLRQGARLCRETLQVLRYLGLRTLVWAGIRQLQRLLGREGIPCAHADDFDPGLITVAILTKDRLDLIRPCVESLLATWPPAYRLQLLLGDTGSRDPRVWRYYRELQESHGVIHVVKLSRYFYSRNYNRLIRRHARGQYLVLLNNDTIMLPGWLEPLIEALADKSIGVAGAKLLFPDGTIQHGGMVFNRDRDGVHLHRGQPGDHPPADIPALVPAVTFACVALRHDVFRRFLLSEEFREECMDSDFCLRLRQAGFRVLYQPRSQLYHLECATRNPDKGGADRERFRVRWGETLEELLSRDTQVQPFPPAAPRPTYTIIRDDGVGDLLAGVSAFAQLRRAHPEARLVLATYARNIRMMAGFGIFDEFVPIPDGCKYAPLPLPRAQREYNFLDFEMDFHARRGLLPWAVPTPDNQLNRHAFYCRELGLKDGFEPVPLPAYPEERRRVEELLARHNLSPELPLVILTLLASNPGRSWWEPYFPALIRFLEEQGLIPVVTGVKDSPYFRGRRLVNLVNQTATITEYIELVKMGRYVICTDTSAYHIAALAGIPFLAIFTGGIHPAARLSLYDKYEVAAPPESLPCYPCWDEGCRDLALRHRREPCRLAITPQMVIAKFRRLAARFPLEGAAASGGGSGGAYPPALLPDFPPLCCCPLPPLKKFYRLQVIRW